MAESEGYQEQLKPWLEAKLNQSFPDPSTFTKEEEFVYAAKVASVFKKVVAEILMWVDGNIQQAKVLEAKRKHGTKETFDIGS